MEKTFLLTHDPKSRVQHTWCLDSEEEQPRLKKVEQGVSFDELDRGYEATTVGSYLLLYRVPDRDDLEHSPYVDFSLINLTADRATIRGEVAQQGSWHWDKFTGDYAYTDIPGGQPVNDLTLTGITGYVLHRLPTAGRSGFGLWNFDAFNNAPKGSNDPIKLSMADSSAFPSIKANEELVPLLNYVLAIDGLERTWRLFSFDPQRPNPLSHPELSSGALPREMAPRLVAIGGRLLAWSPSSDEFTVYDFDVSNPFKNPQTGVKPEGFATEESTRLTVLHPRDTAIQHTAPAATMDFMRDRIKHVVVYVLESRSFDSVVGWLYDQEKAAKINWINAGNARVFNGASETNSNSDSQGHPHYQNKYKSGEVSAEISLTSPLIDPFHDTTDAIDQQWKHGFAAYQSGSQADMGGFVLNNGNDEIMATYSPEQLGVLNGLASWYSVSDEWFSSEAGGTTTNRATIASGSAYNITMSYEGGPAYETFSRRPRRQSMWKVLANHGVMDWAIYYSVEWIGYPYTYHLFLEGQLPSVDAYPGAHSQPIASFLEAAKRGTLPAFSFLEPVWYDPSGMFTSYHPTGDVLPGEQALKNIFDALSGGPSWNETALVISFSKGGGMYDHEPARRMRKAWPNDGNDGYEFDVTGSRVPTLVISPLVDKHTVFRSGQETPFDATSLAATILEWFGIPRSRWGMGDRINAAPTFESVFQLSEPRGDLPDLKRAIDRSYPSDAPIPVASPTPVSSTWTPSRVCPTWTDAHCWSDASNPLVHKVPTDVATFGALDIEDSDAGTVRFAFENPMGVNEIVFARGAPSYTLLIDQETPYRPVLSICGAGVRNESGAEQNFNVLATSVATTDVQLAFLNHASAGDRTIRYKVEPTTPNSQSGGIVAFHQCSTAGSAQFEVRVGARAPQGYATVGAEVRFLDTSDAGSALFSIYGTTGDDSDTFGNVVFHNRSRAAQAEFTNIGGTVGDGGNTQFYDESSADSATIHNYGATGGSGNGGDTAFDGIATAAHATIVNHASPVEGGHGGVTSFNNNPPQMAPGFGATAGEARITNMGTPAGGRGSGGHTEFTGIYGTGSGGNARIENHGAKDAAGQSGYTLFAVNGRWPYAQPTAGKARIINHPGAGAGAPGGRTTFQYQNWNNDGKPWSDGPTAGESHIDNLGSEVEGAFGGITIFSDEAVAAGAQLCATGGVTEAGAGTIKFTGNADGADDSGAKASVDLAGGLLDILESSREQISFGSITMAGGVIRYPLSSSPPLLAVDTFTIDEGQTGHFDFSATGLPPVRVTLVEASEALTVKGKLSGRLPGYDCEFKIEGSRITVQFSVKKNA